MPETASDKSPAPSLAEYLIPVDRLDQRGQERLERIRVERRVDEYRERGEAKDVSAVPEDPRAPLIGRMMRHAGNLIIDKAGNALYNWDMRSRRKHGR